MSVEIWSILHDGVINRIDGSVPGNVSVTVEIEYLRRMFSENGNSIIVSLLTCETFKYQPHEPSELLTDLSAISDIHPEILYADIENDVIHVDCNDGTLWLKYQDFSLMLDDGQPITLNELGDKCDKYWNDWESRK